MRIARYTAPEAEIIMMVPDLNFVNTTGSGTGEDVIIVGGEEDW